MKCRKNVGTREFFSDWNYYSLLCYAMLCLLSMLIIIACLHGDENDSKIDAAGEKRESYRGIVLGGSEKGMGDNT